ncbi:trypsin-like serine protease [Actinoplanes sp. LDG1-06]|uniref:Trypsin-like serine protease n=1 Tax=Paractinoplanes ovalisporus TaxID=2810368 RepID=A0ABS2A5T7_9ACTN|nr:trypsin-like serine protease [Actinoplanes ovalisporus]MBM2614663.1 trypsin-like serine protease [Actinoplanes ovalisporus]
MKTLSRVVVALVAATLGAGALTTPAHAIANGEDVADGQYKFAVKLTDIGIPTKDGGKRNSSCSGGLISPRWVLTAGHCFKDENDRRVSRPVADRTVATIGRADLTGTAGFSANVVEVRQHGDADVALARLDRPITAIAPMRLNRKKPVKGQKVRLVGFGDLKDNAKRTTDRLQTGVFEVTSTSKLEMGVIGTSPADDTSACPHDSGGPYFVGSPTGVATVVGVVSRGPSCPHSGADTSARVDSIAPWILSVIGADLRTAVRPSTKPPAASPPQARQNPAAAAREPADDEPVPPLLWLAAVPIVLLIGALVMWTARPRRGSHRRR